MLYNKACYKRWTLIFESRQQFAKIKDTNTKLAKDISTELKTLQQLLSPGDNDQKKRLDAVQNDYTKLLKDFNSILCETSNKESLKIKKLSTRKRKESTAEKKRKLSDAQIQLQEEEEKMLQERQNNLKQLEADILDLSEIFKVFLN